MRELKLPATIDSINRVTDFVDRELEKIGCPIKNVYQINIAIDELLANISMYAYEKSGEAIVQYEVERSPAAVVLRFIDSGVPYNPLDKEDPDVTLSAEQRNIGGLGIFMVKQSMDHVSYEYKDRKNIVTIKKIIDMGGKSNDDQ